MSRPAAVTVHGLRKVYRLRGNQEIVANDSLSFEVYRGEIFGLLGPNGAGKTTLILQLLGLLRPTAGQIDVEGIDVMRFPDQVKALAGFTPQTGLAMRLINVERALRYTGRLRGQSEADARAQTRQLMAALELDSVAGVDVHRLSGGMARTVNFAMALMGHPRLLVLDEPTNELDPRHRRAVWTMLEQIVSADRGVTCILVTHNVLEAERVVNRVGVMQRGKLIAVGTPGEIKALIGNTVRVEFRLKEGEAEVSPEQLAGLAQRGHIERSERLREGGYRLYVDPAHIGGGVESILQMVGMAKIDDFRIAPLSLEDAYLSLGEEPQ